MTANIHVPLLRMGRVVLFAVMWASCLAVLFLLPPSVAHREGTKAFLGFGMLLPLVFGLPLAAALHEVMHRPFALLLPAARRRFLHSHAVVTGVCALSCAGFAVLADRSLPFAAVASIASTAFALPLLFEPGLRWAGSRAAAIIVVAAAGAALMQAGSIKTMVITHPFAGGAAGLALTALIFGASFSSRRRRARALTPYTSYFSAAFAPALKARMSREAIARKSISHARWRLLALGDSTAAWVRAGFYERFGHERWGWAGMMLGISAALIALGVVLAAKDPGRFAERGAQNLAYVVLFSLVVQRSCGPQPARIYPLSRARRATVTFAASAWQLGMSAGLFFIATLTTAGIAARWFGVELQPSVIGMLAMPFIFALLFGPLVQWLSLQMEVRNDPSFQILCSLLAIVAPLAGYHYAQRWPSALFTPSVLAIVVLSIGVSQLSYYAALRRFYRGGDLVQRDARSA